MILPGRGRAAASPVLVCTVLVACGVPDGAYRAALRDLEREKAAAAAQSRSHDQAQAEARRHLDACDEARVAAEARTGLLEQQLLRSTEARGELAGDLQTVEARALRLQREQARADAQRQALLGLVERFRTLSEDGLVTVDIVAGRLTLTLQADELFEEGSAVVRADGARTLDRLAEALRAAPAEEFRVEGHTDLAAGTREQGWALSLSWATAVVEALVVRDVAAERLSAAGFSASRMLVGNGTEGHRALNRRVQLVHMPSLTGIPGFDVEVPAPAARVGE